MLILYLHVLKILNLLLRVGNKWLALLQRRKSIQLLGRTGGPNPAEFRTSAGQVTRCGLLNEFVLSHFCLFNSL